MKSNEMLIYSTGSKLLSLSVGPFSEGSKIISSALSPLKAYQFPLNLHEVVFTSIKSLEPTSLDLPQRLQIHLKPLQ